MILTNDELHELIRAIKSILALHPEFKYKGAPLSLHPLAGMCYIASEVLYHATGGQLRWDIYNTKHEGIII